MKTAIYEKIASCLPPQVVCAMEHIKTAGRAEWLEEIRLRCGSYQSLTVKNENYIICSDGRVGKKVYDPLVLTEDEINDTLCRLCGGALYSHSEELSKGFVTVDGIRVGACGAGIMKNGVAAGFSSCYSLNIRIPRHISGAAKCLLELMEKYGSDNVGGVLVVSPPGVGKTTFLRSFAAAISKGYSDKGIYTVKRIAVADERGELHMPWVFQKSLCDAITFLPKAAAIEMLTRSMAPQYIFCDEISYTEAETVAAAASKGIIFAASCHGEGLSDISKNSSIKKLLDNGVFSTVCTLYIRDFSRYCRAVRVSDGAVLNEGRVAEC